MLLCFREGRSNAHIKGDYQRIGDVMLKNFQGLKVRHCSYISVIRVVLNVVIYTCYTHTHLVLSP